MAFNKDKVLAEFDMWKEGWDSRKYHVDVHGKKIKSHSPFSNGLTEGNRNSPQTGMRIQLGLLGLSVFLAGVAIIGWAQ